MRAFATVFLASIASAFAYQVTSPGDAQGWSTSGPNYLKWQRVDTDPLNFTAVLTNVNQAVMPLGNQVLNALVDGTLSQIICNPPSGGWPSGAGFRVNLAADAEHLDTLLAQSDQFSITAPSSSSGATTSSSSTSCVLPLYRPSVTNIITARVPLAIRRPPRLREPRLVRIPVLVPPVTRAPRSD
ncbi:hypothetical protein BV22DRAFT_998503 [Leucogyrophana mollusca]|uniref:Uncharacterized protein n=1 Tax=Leucogyrophana mollusca TaxID=85980 RepID=A0ACB8C1M1_9AGAM|nr:hypothetical protein BV22DRAFT_998503 [Leucogyrophana mollusca]